MTLEEAEELLGDIQAERKTAAYVHPVAGGEQFVVILKGAGYWLWNKDDWLAFRDAKKMPVKAS